MAQVTLTIDHRVVEGHQTNAWLKRFVEIIEGWPAASYFRLSFKGNGNPPQRLVSNAVAIPSRHLPAAENVMPSSRKPDSERADWNTAADWKTGKVALGAGAVVAAAGAAFLLKRKSGLINRKSGDGGEAYISDSPPWTHKVRPSGEHGELIGRSQTINRPRREVYDRWRDFTRFPDFMDNVRSIEKVDDKTSRWTIEAPAGKTVELVTEITHDVPGERIAWKSVAESQIDTAGEVLFKDAAPGRGTVVTLILTYAPPGGTIGKLAAKLFRREPAIQARLDLRRFKQLLETGEVTTNASPSARSSETPTEARI